MRVLCFAVIFNVVGLHDLWPTSLLLTTRPARAALQWAQEASEYVYTPSTSCTD
jgi:hypothetical protein